MFAFFVRHGFFDWARPANKQQRSHYKGYGTEQEKEPKANHEGQTNQPRHKDKTPKILTSLLVLFVQACWADYERDAPQVDPTKAGEALHLLLLAVKPRQI